MSEMSKYKWVLFDADNTLFHFRDQSGLCKMFEKYNIDFLHADYQEYKVLNSSLWQRYEQGEITAKDLAEQRFAKWAALLNVSPQQLNIDFMQVMAQVCAPLPGLTELLTALKGNMKLGIITNGFTALQQSRLEYNKLLGYFEFVVTSEEVGKAKPHPDIFNKAFEYIGDIDRKQILMVGDNPSSDICGGNNVGVDTCWLNVDSKPVNITIKPNYQVSSLLELKKLLTASIAVL